MADKSKIILYVQGRAPHPPKTCCPDGGCDNNGVMPSPYRGMKREAERGGETARLHWQRQQLCLRLSVCVWPAGTGTADPPLTPGGVHRAVEEDEWRWGGNGIYHLDKKRGGALHHLQESH